MTRDEEYQGDARASTGNMAHKIHFLLDTYNLWSEEGTFTFPDGLTIERLKESQ